METRTIGGRPPIAVGLGGDDVGGRLDRAAAAAER